MLPTANPSVIPLCRNTIEFTEGSSSDDKAVSTSSNAACGLVSPGTREGSRSHEYELVALDQSQTEPSTTAGPSQQQTSPHAMPGSGTETQEPTYECIAGN